MKVVQRVQEHQGLGDLQQYLGCLRHTRSVALQKNIFLLLRKNICLLVEYEKYLGQRAVFSYEDNIYETQINNNSETGCGWLCCIKLSGPSYQFPQNYATQLSSACRDYTSRLPLCAVQVLKIRQPRTDKIVTKLQCFICICLQSRPGSPNVVC